MPDFEKMTSGFAATSIHTLAYIELCADAMRYFYEHFECECEYRGEAIEWGCKFCPQCGGLVGKVKEEKECKQSG